MKKINNILSIMEASLNGSLDGLELDNTDDVIEKSSVIENIKDLLKLVKEAQQEVKNCSIPAVSKIVDDDNHNSLTEINIGKTDELYIQLLIGKVSESLGFNKTVEIVKEVNDALRKPVVSGRISLEVATKRIRQVVEYSKYKSWNNEVGEQRAKSIMDDFHNGFYGSKNWMWVQVNEAVELLEYLYSR